MSDRDGSDNKALDIAIEIGRECSDIESAINQLDVAVRNHNEGSKVWDSPLFEVLSARREVLRSELLALGREVSDD